MGEEEGIEEESSQVIKDKLEIFFKRKDLIHITLNNRYIRNGKILEFHKNYILLDDKVLGAVPIFFSEIFEVNKKRYFKGDEIKNGNF